MADDPSPAPASSWPLSDLELAVLAIEEEPWQHQGVKEQAIRDRLNLSSTSYYQVLNLLLENQRALEHSPVVVNRLLRIREDRFSKGAR